MEPDPTKDAVRRAWSAFATRDAAQVESAFTEDARWLPPPGNATAVAVGHDDVQELDRAAIARFFVHEFPKLFVANAESIPRRLVAEGNVAVLETTFKAKVANGRDYENDYCFVLEVREGRIHRMREYMDTQRGFRAMFGDEAPRCLIG